MTRLPVHCCCNPDRRLGFVEVRDEDAHVGNIRFRIPPRMSSLPVKGEMVGFDGTMDPGRTIYTQIEILQTVEPHRALGIDYTVETKRELAVKSAHLDVDVWRQVLGFQEDPDGKA